MNRPDSTFNGIQPSANPSSTAPVMVAASAGTKGAATRSRRRRVRSSTVPTGTPEDGPGPPSLSRGRGRMSIVEPEMAEAPPRNREAHRLGRDRSSREHGYLHLEHVPSLDFAAVAPAMSAAIASRRSPSRIARFYEVAHIADVSKTTYALATPRCLDCRHDLPRASTNNDPSNSDSPDPCGRPATGHRGDRRSPRLPVADGLVLANVLDSVLARNGRITHRRPPQSGSWCAWRSADQHGVAGTWPSRVRPDRTVAGPRRPEPARGSDRQRREGDDGLSRAP